MLQLLGRDLAGQQGDDMPGLALAADPLLIIRLGHRGETYLLVEFVGCEQHILEHRRGTLGIGNVDQNAERKGVMDHRLTDVQNAHAAMGQDAHDGRGQTGTVFTGNVDQDDFAQGALSRAGCDPHLPCRPGKRRLFYPLSALPDR